MSDKPLVYLIHGDDTFAMSGFIKQMLARMGDPAMADLNTTRLDGRSASDVQINDALMSMPFLAERRLVILSNPLARLGSKNAQAHFMTLLDTLPPTTALVLLVEDEFLGKNKGWNTLKEKHWLNTWKETAGERVHYQLCQLPEQANMPRWITKKAKELGGEFAPDAAHLLADFVGNHTRLATQEIIKLLTFVDTQRPVTLDDVQDLSVPGNQANIFEMADAITEGQAQKAFNLLHDLMQEHGAFELFFMIVRQFRLLLQARELLDEGGQPAQMASELHVHPFVAGKLARQAPRFSLTALESIYHRLHETDRAIKTGQMEAEVALDLLLADLVR